VSEHFVVNFLCFDLSLVKIIRASMTCCSFVALAAPISIFSSLNRLFLPPKYHAFLPHNLGRRNLCPKINFQSCLQGSQIVPPPLKPVCQSEDHDPYIANDIVYKGFMTACSQAFKSNGWVHVPNYLGADEIQGLLSEATRHLENVRIDLFLS
jgi:hypothetical protein